MLHIMKLRRKLFVLLLFIAPLPAFGISYLAFRLPALSDAHRINKGMTRSEVHTLLGGPPLSVSAGHNAVNPDVST